MVDTSGAEKPDRQGVTSQTCRTLRTTILLDHLCTHGVACGSMAEEQLSFSPAALAGGLESQTCQLLQNEQQKVTDAASKLDLLSRELQSMWSAQGSPATQQATMHPLQKQGRSFSAPDAVSRLDGQSEHGGLRSSGGPVQTLTPTEPQSLPSLYTFDPLPLPGPVKPPRTHRGRLERGYAVPYSPQEQLQSKNAPPPPRNQSGYLMPYSPEEQRQPERAPSPRNQSGYLIPYSPEEQRQPERAPSPRLMQGYQIPYSPEEQRQPDRYLIPYSPEEQRQPERAPSPRLMQGYQIPYSPEEQRQPDRYLIPYSPEDQRQPERAPSPRNQSGYLIPYSPEEPRHPSDRAPSPRQLQPLAPSFHPTAEAENPYSEPTALRDPVPPPAGGAPNVSGVFGPVAHPPFTGGPASAPTFYIGNETWGSPQPHYPPTSAGTERSKMAFDALDASPTPRPKPDFTTNIYSGDSTSQRKPAGVWAEADLDIAYEKKSKTPSQESKGNPRSWSLPRLGRDSWKQTDLDLANPISKPAKGRLDVDTIQLYGTLPKGSLPPWGTQLSPPRSRRPLSPWGSPVLARSHFPPASPWTSAIKERRNVLPLSVLIRPTIVRGRGRGGGWGPWGPPPLVPGPLAPGPLASGPPHRQPQTPQGQQAVVPVLLVDAGETESPGGEGGGETTPRPLSPTRLQPVSVPDTGCIRDREELLRIRAAIPRALKKRSSIDHTAETVAGPVAATVKPSQPLPTILDQQVPSDQHQDTPTTPPPPQDISPTHTDTHATRSILKKEGSSRSSKKRKARLNPLVVLLDASLLGELDVVQRLVQEIADPSESNDEGITALHNAVCGGHYDIVEFLVNHGVNVNAADSHGWTPLHCAASCNDLPICTLLVKKGAAIFCTTLNDGATAAEKCDAYLDGYEDCARFLFSAEQQAGMMNSAVLYALWDYEAEREDELSLREGQAVTVLQRGSRNEPLWWWSSLYGHEGYVAHNLLGLFPRVRPAT